MIRRTKGTKRYAQQRERMFTEPLIREDELQRVKEARERLSQSADNGKENKGGIRDEGN